jgi:acetyltransferase-like isoleucine patch superfamily enzyme
VVALEFRELVNEGVVTVGDHTYGVPKVHVWRDRAGRSHGGVVSIGSFCAIGPSVEILTGGNHRTDWVSTYPLRLRFNLPGLEQEGIPTSRGDVIVGNDVWIATGAKILSGVRIGDGAVIGAYSVVSRDVRPYAVVVGNPAREIRRRFSDDRISRLEALQWWNWPPERIAATVDRISSPNVDELLEGCSHELGVKAGDPEAPHTVPPGPSAEERGA